MSHTGTWLSLTSFVFNGYYSASTQPASSMVMRPLSKCALLQQNGRCRVLQRTLSARQLLTD